MRVTQEQYEAILARRLKRVSDNAGPKLQGAELECAAGDATLAAVQTKKGDTGRFLVVVTSHRTRLLDQDNLAAKAIIDCCRYAGLIPDDSPDKAEIQVHQVKVKKADERTEVTISRIPSWKPNT